MTLTDFALPVTSDLAAPFDQWRQAKALDDAAPDIDRFQARCDAIVQIEAMAMAARWAGWGMAGPILPVW